MAHDTYKGSDPRISHVVNDMEAVREFTVKDSGQRVQFESGMVRDVTEGKTSWSLVYDGPMLARWATHLTKGAIKYAKRNWMKAAGHEELERAKDSAARHFAQWMAGEVDEDHASAVFFNINLAEYVKGKMDSRVIPPAESAAQTIHEALSRRVHPQTQTSTVRAR